MIVKYRFISPIKANADDFEARMKTKKGAIHVQRADMTGSVVKDAKGVVTLISPDKMPCKGLEKDKDGKDIPGEIVVDAPMYVVEMDVMP